MRISDWSSDVCSSDLWPAGLRGRPSSGALRPNPPVAEQRIAPPSRHSVLRQRQDRACPCPSWLQPRSEEHTSELQSLMRISYAVFCLKKKKKKNKHTHNRMTL